MASSGFSFEYRCTKCDQRKAWIFMHSPETSGNNICLSCRGGGDCAACGQKYRCVIFNGDRCSGCIERGIQPRAYEAKEEKNARRSSRVKVGPKCDLCKKEMEKDDIATDVALSLRCWTCYLKPLDKEAKTEPASSSSSSSSSSSAPVPTTEPGPTVNCPVCWEPFGCLASNTPRSFGCGHSVCTACNKRLPIQLSGKHRGTPTPYMKCPVCREYSQIEKEVRLPVNYCMKELLQLKTTAKRKAPESASSTQPSAAKISKKERASRIISLVSDDDEEMAAHSSTSLVLDIALHQVRTVKRIKKAVGKSFPGYSKAAVMVQHAKREWNNAAAVEKENNGGFPETAACRKRRLLAEAESANKLTRVEAKAVEAVVETKLVEPIYELVERFSELRSAMEKLDCDFGSGIAAAPVRVVDRLVIGERFSDRYEFVNRRSMLRDRLHLEIGLEQCKIRYVATVEALVDTVEPGVTESIDDKERFSDLHSQVRCHNMENMKPVYSMEELGSELAAVMPVRGNVVDRMVIQERFTNGRKITFLATVDALGDMFKDLRVSEAEI